MAQSPKEKKSFKDVLQARSRGTDPWNQYDIRAGVSEEALDEGLVDAYLKYRGIDPKHLPRHKKAAHGRSKEFQKWKHENPAIKESINEDEGDHTIIVPSFHDHRHEMRLPNSSEEKAARQHLKKMGRHEIGGSIAVHKQTGEIHMLHGSNVYGDNMKHSHIPGLHKEEHEAVYGGDSGRSGEPSNSEGHPEVPLKRKMLKKEEVEELLESPKNAWQNRMKNKHGHVVFHDSDHPSTKNELTHAYKIVDGKKHHVGSFNILTNKEVTNESYSELETEKDKDGHQVLTKKGQEQLQKYKDEQEENKRRAKIAKNSHYEKYKTSSKTTSSHLVPNKESFEIHKDRVDPAIDLVKKNIGGAEKPKKKLLQEPEKDTQEDSGPPSDPKGTISKVAEETSMKKRALSKSARMIKALYKKHRMVKEEILHEDLSGFGHTMKKFGYERHHESGSHATSWFRRGGHIVTDYGRGQWEHTHFDNPGVSKSGHGQESLEKHLSSLHGMKEDTYDWEKDDKKPATTGKAPKLIKGTEKVDKNAQDSDNQQPAAVLSGGKTMTGQPRDDIEIDPMMKKRPTTNNDQQK